MNKRFNQLDADESIFFEKELEFLKARTFDILFPELKAREMIPVSFEADPGAESITYHQFDQIGLAKLIANYADDLPRADVAAKEFITPVKSLGASYGWNLQEIRAAARAGKSLNERRLTAARRAHMSRENALAWFGDTICGLPGFLDNPNINTVILPADGVGAATTFVSKQGTPDLIIRDMHSMGTTIHSVSKGVESPDTMLLPISQFNLVFTTRVGDGDLTIARFFLNSSPHIQNLDWLPTELSGTGGGGTDVMIAYRRSPDKLSLEIPQDFEQLPVQERNLEFVIPTHQRYGGVLMYYPLSVAKADGV